jgi:hypothetical protein
LKCCWLVSLEQEGLSRTGILVHYLDVGGAQPPEAAGVESILAGLRETFTDDEQLLNAACPFLTASADLQQKRLQRR